MNATQEQIQNALNQSDFSQKVQTTLEAIGQMYSAFLELDANNQNTQKDFTQKRDEIKDFCEKASANLSQIKTDIEALGAAYSYNHTNAEQTGKLDVYNANHTSKISDFDSNAQTKTEDFNNNASAKIQDFDSNAQEKTQEYNELVKSTKEQIRQALKDFNDSLEAYKEKVKQASKDLDSEIYILEDSIVSKLKIYIDEAIKSADTSEGTSS